MTMSWKCFHICKFVLRLLLSLISPHLNLRICWITLYWSCLNMIIKTAWVYIPHEFTHQKGHSSRSYANGSGISKTIHLIESVEILGLCTINGNNILFNDFIVGWLLACIFDLLLLVGEILTIKSMMGENGLLLMVLDEFMMSLNCLQFGLLGHGWIGILICWDLVCVNSQNG